MTNIEIKNFKLVILKTKKGAAFVKLHGTIKLFIARTVYSCKHAFEKYGELLWQLSITGVYFNWGKTEQMFSFAV